MSRLKGQQSQVRCHTCRHPRRVEMERLIARGASIPKVAEKFDVNSFALRRHWQTHVSDRARLEYAAGADLDKLNEVVVAENTSVLGHYATVRNKLYARLDAACEADDRINTCRLATVLHENFRDVARVTGELQKSPLMVQQNNYLAGDNARVIAAVVSAASPYPEAARAITAALRRLEAADQPLLEHPGAE